MTQTFLTQKIDTGSQRFEQGFEGWIDRLELRLQGAWESRFTRNIARLGALALTLFLLLAAYVCGAQGLAGFSTLCTVAGGVLGTAGLLLLFIFPGAE